jgi:hypothetical protein
MLAAMFRIGDRVIVSTAAGELAGVIELEVDLFAIQLDGEFPRAMVTSASTGLTWLRPTRLPGC